ncbi:hypothetical protein CO2235_200090 [Cupriavidus oxalaticus]|uniref:Uncharacterized protein n=1 Tax=Cupriavidus oxalaticus TaxID=96344 RepID=A0A976BCM2_9BURK|nr:hypothetical protein CO2235_200090 [Cupriavidus oxalaticus]
MRRGSLQNLSNRPQACTKWQIASQKPVHHCTK